MALEEQLLDQIRVVYSGGVFPVWVDQHTVIYIKIGELFFGLLCNTGDSV